MKVCGSATRVKRVQQYYGRVIVEDLRDKRSIVLTIDFSRYVKLKFWQDSKSSYRETI